MKPFILVCAMFCGVCLFSVGARAAEWSDLNVLQINREKPRATKLMDIKEPKVTKKRKKKS